MWREDDLQGAVPLFESVVDEFPDAEVAVHSAELLLDSLNRLGAHDQMEAWVDRLRSEPRFAPLRDKLEILEPLALQFRRRAAENLEQQGEHAACGRAYEDLYQTDPAAADGPQLLYNATVCYLAAGRRTDASRTADRLKRDWPTSDLTRRAGERLRQRP